MAVSGLHCVLKSPTNSEYGIEVKVQVPVSSMSQISNRSSKGLLLESQVVHHAMSWDNQEQNQCLLQHHSKGERQYK